MTTNKLIDEKVENVLRIANQNTMLRDFYIPTEAIDYFRQALQEISHATEQRVREEIVGLISQMLIKPLEIEQKHQEQFRKDEMRYRINPSEANLAKMKIHEGGSSQYFGGRNQGYIEALETLQKSLQEPVTEE